MLATTTSVDATGLLDVLADAFKSETGITLKWIAVGTGAALKQARDGNADVVIAHARKLEDEFLRDGFGVNRRVIARNYLHDRRPARRPGPRRRRRIRRRGLRPDQVGRLALRQPRRQVRDAHPRARPLGPGRRAAVDAAYLETGQGMAETLRVAAERRAYTLTDTATFFGLPALAGLRPVFENGPELENIYAVIAVNPARVPSARYAEAMAFIAFLTSPRGQKLIGDVQGQGRPAALRAPRRDARGGPRQMIFRELALAVWVSLKTSGLAALIASLLAVPAALFLAGREFRGKKLILVINQTWMAAPTVVIGLLFYSLLSRSGPLGRFGLLYTQAAMTIGQVFLILPLIVGFSYTALRQVDRRARLTALTLGATPRQAGWVVLREARFPLLVAVLAGFARAVSEVGIAMMLGGNIRNVTRNITTSIALETAKGEFRNGVVLGAILLVITLGINVLVQTGLRGRRRGLTWATPSTVSRTSPSGTPARRHRRSGSRSTP